MPLPPLGVEVSVNVLPAHREVPEGLADMVGLERTEKVAVLAADTEVLQPPPAAIAVTVTVVVPVAVSADDGIVKVPLSAPIDKVAVFPVELLAPLKL